MEKSIVPPSVQGISSTVTLTLEQLPQNKVDAFVSDYNRSDKIISLGYIFLLFLGAHYAYVGKWGMFALFLLTGGGCGIWWFIDLFRIPQIVSDYNNELAHNILRTLK
jgi:TM2 domain-containing membrane protein YozV